MHVKQPVYKLKYTLFEKKNNSCPEIESGGFWQLADSAST